MHEGRPWTEDLIVFRPRLLSRRAILCRRKEGPTHWAGDGSSPTRNKRTNVFHRTDMGLNLRLVFEHLSVCEISSCFSTECLY